ncbi:phage DNA ejection protein [Pectobacterium polonicum]|uniref:Phage DNA ejection protein n=1 Tax=Pectobacterium polonicum TaxID=2485124 RepID=A0ABV1PGN2_9GAMM
MATWQLGGLTSMAPQNDNAPRSAVPEPMQYQQQPNVGLMALQGLGGFAEIRQRAQQQQQRQDFQKKLGGFVSQNDRAGAQKLIAEYPQFMEEAQKQMGFIDAEQNKQTASAAMNLRIASQSKDPRLMQNAIQNASPVLQRFGLSPDEVYQSWQQNPQGFDHTADLIQLHADPKSYFDVTNDQAQRQNDADRNTETRRNNDMENARGWGQIAVSRENSIRSAYAPTAAMQNYTQYAQMIKTDPEGAKAFAQAAGINTDQKKLMKVEKNDDGSVTKYYTDGSEESGKLLQPISADGIRPISLPQAQVVMEKAPEGAKKAAGFAYRVRNNLDAIDALKVEPKRIAMINTALGQGNIGNLNLSGPEQQYVAYAGDSIAAVLRQESGAAIPLDEQMSYYKRYFPQVGDSENTIKTKRHLMENQFKALRGASGRAYDALTVMSAADPAPPTPPSNSGMQGDQRLPSYPGEQQKPAVQTKSWSELP